MHNGDGGQDGYSANSFGAFSYKEILSPTKQARVTNAGDFNCVLSAAERIGGNTPSSEIDSFRSCVDDCGVIDITSVGSVFTWNNKQKPEARIYSRLDRFLINKDWSDHLHEAYAHFLPDGLYDHTPCIVSHSQQIKSKSSFKSLICGELLQIFSLQSEGIGIGHCLQQVQKLQEDIGQDPSNLQLIEEVFRPVQELKELSEARDTFLAQKSKQVWIQEGDSNSAFFHGMLKRRRSGNKLLGTSQETSKIHKRIIDQGPRCSEEMVGSLLVPITAKEIRDVMFSIPYIKSPGPDGYTSRFFKDAWNEIGGDVVTAVKDFFINKKLLRQLNATNLTLIPKCDRPKSVL
ncbi:uncharacterized protein LOC141637889 [Silene latifolia]|uniref:uncharacterized protein LOC141637889 n=1 Tax=Silene latifolia TaxID=37657 RepID=UPI003D780F98